MKKTIFDLSYKEGKKLDKEIKKSSYFLQYFKGFVIVVILLLCVFVGALSLLQGSDESISIGTIVVSIIVMFGFIFLYTLLMYFKRFDLIKQYYDEKYNNR